MTHSKDIPLDPKALDWAGIDDAFHVGLSHYTNVSLPNSVAKPLHDWIESQRASLRPAADPKAEAVGCVLGMGLQLLSEGYSATIWPVASVSDVQDDTVHPLFAAPPTPDAERAGEPPVAWRWRYIYPTGPGGWHLRASMVEATPSTKWECEREVEPLYASPQSPATEAVTEAMVDVLIAGVFGHDPGGLTRLRMRAALEAALIRPPVNNSPGGEHIVADVSKAAAYCPAIIHFDEGGFDEFVTEDTATITGEMRAANIEPIFRMAEPRDLIGYRIYDAAPPADTEGATKP